MLLFSNLIVCTSTLLNSKHTSARSVKFYDHNVEVVVSPILLAIHWSKHYKGSDSDLAIFWDIRTLFKYFLAKVEDNIFLEDDGEDKENYSTSWGVL